MTLPGHLFAAPLQTNIQMVPVALIVPPDTRDTIPSVQRLGVMQSVLLKPSGNPRLPYLIVDGDRRVNSALKYGLDVVPALITDGTRGQIAAASAILNAARSSNPLDEARSWQTALEEGQFRDVAELAAHVRINAATIKKRLKLLALPEDLLAHVGVSIAEGVAERMANLPPEYRQQAIQAAERTLDAGKKFTAADLKESQTARTQDLHAGLDQLFDAAPLLTVQRDPLADLVGEVKRLAALNGIDLPVLLRELRRALPAPNVPDAPVPVPPPPAPPAAPVAPPRAGRVNLGLRPN
ncbi:ParB/RepB/Spo0J family partition protein [Deinococcus aluminii]|uniref:ParB/RepB/Spo0J family partition protein n=1 Tax=Deinococcus aluminii TaxID=1656885 RepID=A0ABP9XER4_9DEIO